MNSLLATNINGGANNQQVANKSSSSVLSSSIEFTLTGTMTNSPSPLGKNMIRLMGKEELLFSGQNKMKNCDQNRNLIGKNMVRLTGKEELLFSGQNKMKNCDQNRNLIGKNKIRRTGKEELSFNGQKRMKNCDQNRNLIVSGMAFPGSKWPYGGNVWSDSSSAVEEFHWNIGDFLKKCRQKRKKLEAADKRVKTKTLLFAEAEWTLFLSLDQDDCRCRFVVSVEPHYDIDYEFECCGDIYFVRRTATDIKNIRCQFNYGNVGSHFKVEDFLVESELDDFLQEGFRIDCRFLTRRLSVMGARPPTDIIDVVRSTGAKEASTRIQPFESKDGEVSRINPVCSVFRDLKQLLLSGEESDTTVQVQGQSFRVHRSILTARSSVFASMFRQNMKEKATRVVDLQDCEASAFPVFLEYLYCGSTEKFSTDNVFGLYASANKYNMHDLKTECLEFIRKHLSVETFCETVRLSLLHSQSNLLNFSVDFFARNMKDIVKSAKWQAFIVENPIQGNEIYIKALGFNE